MTDDIKAAEARGYSKGYAASVRRKQRKVSAESEAKQRAAFWNRAFLAALPTCIDVQGWQRNGQPIKSLQDRTQLAADFADHALQKHWKQWA